MNSKAGWLVLLAREKAYKGKHRPFFNHRAQEPGNTLTVWFGSSDDGHFAIASKIYE